MRAVDQKHENNLEWTNNDFQGTGHFQFPEAVVTSTVKESLRSTKHSSLQVLTVIGVETAVYNCNKLRY